MQQNPNPLYTAKNIHDQPGEKTNEDFNGTPPAPKDPDLLITRPDKETPAVTADYEEMTEDETTDEDEFVPSRQKNHGEPTYLDIIDE